MNVAILGNEDLDFDIGALNRFVKNCAYPHPVSMIVTSHGMGVMESARMMAKEYGIRLELSDDINDTLSLCDMVVCLRKKSDYPYIAKLCARRGKLFKEYVV